MWKICHGYLTNRDFFKTGFWTEKKCIILGQYKLHAFPPFCMNVHIFVKLNRKVSWSFNIQVPTLMIKDEVGDEIHSMNCILLMWDWIQYQVRVRIYVP